MTYAFVRDVPANAEMYGRIKALLPAEAPGMVVHLAFEHEGGLRYVDVWETEADWDRFRAEHVDPAVDKVLAEYGIPHDHDATPLHEAAVVDVWLGHAPPAS